MIISMPKVLLDKLGTDGAEALVHVLNETTTNTRTDIATKTDLAELKAELLKWIFIFWIGQVATILGVLFVFFKK